MPGSFSTVLAHMEPPSSRKQAKRVRLGPKRTLLGAPDVLGEPRGADLVPTTPDWPAWVGFMVTTHFGLLFGVTLEIVRTGRQQLASCASTPRRAPPTSFFWIFE